MRTRVKICGITRLQDAIDAIAAGVDALGFVFYPKSPRYISPENAKLIIRSMPAFVTSVGLFVNEEADRVESVASNCGLDLLQFHGAESAAFCEGFQRRYIKAVGVTSDTSWSKLEQEYCKSSGLLLDKFDPKRFGGTGQGFDWTCIPTGFSLPLIVAGGLTPENVAQVVQSHTPYGVDVSSGVELEKGIKSQHKMQNFILNVSYATPCNAN
jgi:phosphoribosylanthranilate isomerase